MDSEIATEMSISERLASLSNESESSWRKRMADRKMGENDVEVVFRKAKDNGRTTPVKERPGTVAERLSQLTNSEKKWQSKVSDSGKAEAKRLTVAGRLAEAGFKLPENASSTPEGSVTGDSPLFKRTDNNSATPRSLGKFRSETTKCVEIPRNLDVGFDDFFGRPSVEEQCGNNERLAVSPMDLAITGASGDYFLAPAGNTRLGRSFDKPRGPHRRNKSANPIKALANTPGLTTYSYMETSIAFRPVSMAIAPLGVNQPPKSRPKSEYIVGFDPEAVAGSRGKQLCSEAIQALETKEDFSAIKLKKADVTRTPSSVLLYPPYKDVMLIKVKGRRRVVAHLVEPNISALSSDCCYLYVDLKNCFVFDGSFSNVLEKAKAKELANFIIESRDLGCRDISKVVTIDESSTKVQLEDLPQNARHLLILLGGSSSYLNVSAPSDFVADERYEDDYCSKSQVYRFVGDSLEFDSTLSHRSLFQHELEPQQVFVFDFGSEVYVWGGRSTFGDRRREAAKLAASQLFSNRPNWHLLGELKDRMETCLFKSKFDGWPDINALKAVELKQQRSSPPKVIREFLTRSTVRSDVAPSAQHILEAKDPTWRRRDPSALGVELRSRLRREPDLVLEDQHLGRGRFIRNSDDPVVASFDIITEGVKSWHCKFAEGNTCFASPIEDNNQLGLFYSAECFIVRWQYRISLHGCVSLNKFAESKETGRSRLAYFYWIGNDATRSQQGQCALAVKELDVDRAPHIRVVQGLEPPAFLNLFDGKFIVLDGKRPKDISKEIVADSSPNSWHLFSVGGGPRDTETGLFEVESSDFDGSLRSQGSFVIVDPTVNTCLQWTGTKCPAHIKENGRKAAENLIDRFVTLVSLKLKYESVSEDDELKRNETFSRLLQSGKTLSYYKVGDSFRSDATIRLFHIVELGGGSFGANELVGCTYDARLSTPFPFEQDDIYGIEQPGFFIVDQGGKVWLWEGWLAGNGLTDDALLQKRRLRRLFALQVAVAYANPLLSDAYVVYAGMEPDGFKALFPKWTHNDEAREASEKEGRKPGAEVSANRLLAELTKRDYDLDSLRRRPLPEGVDADRLESYLSDETFMSLFLMSKETFATLPKWKQTLLKQEHNLF